MAEGSASASTSLHRQRQIGALTDVTWGVVGVEWKGRAATEECRGQSKLCAQSTAISATAYELSARIYMCHKGPQIQNIRSNGNTLEIRLADLGCCPAPPPRNTRQSAEAST